MMNAKVKRFYKEMPEIPGVVYKGVSKNLRTLGLVLGACIMALFEDGVLGVLISTLMLIAALFYWRFAADRPHRVFFSQTDFKAYYPPGKVVQDTLGLYFLYIYAASRMHKGAYTYSVALIPKEETARVKDKVSNLPYMRLALVDKGKIPVAERILTPENLREYVEGIQNQLESPLELLFGSEKTFQEYREGRFLK